MTYSGRRLTRIPSRGRIAGVCAGLAAHYDVDVTLVRLLWVVLSIVPCMIIGGVLAYAAAWFLMPAASELEAPVPAGKRLERSATDRKVAGICGGLAEYFDVDPTLVRVGVAVLAIYPGAVVLGLLCYLVAWAVIPLRGPRAFTTAASPA
jgi:phage shock protein PspC (stress-responsive transcriptional regulator)